MNTVEVGSGLRQERLRRGLSLESIAAQTRISPRFLAAIEAGDFESLPGLVFSRSFVRQFAHVLGMDPEPLLAELLKVDVEASPLPDAAQFARRRRRNPQWAAALSSVMWVALAISVSAGAYVYFNPKQAAPGKTAGIPQVASEPSVSDSANHPMQVVLRAREAAWVRITADGRNSFTGMLRPNDSREVEANARVKVTTGNAGGLDISLNGKSLDPLGPPGKVRTVELTADGSPQSLEP